MPDNIPYKSFCWCFGTTSFRTKNFNKTIEEQLALLNDFWQLPENENLQWGAVQSDYYDFMKSNGFVEGNAPNKPKDAREKTSGLLDIGLIDGEHKLTDAGSKLLSISKSMDFIPDNFFDIPKDSYVYLKQLLKTSSNIGDTPVRPFIVLLYLLSKFDYLTMEEFAYLLPLCIDKTTTEEIIECITEYRAGRQKIDDIILNRLLEMENYQNALEYLMSSTVTEDVICRIGMNRKSRTFDKPYFPLYNALYSVFVDGETDKIPLVYSLIKKMNLATLWRKYLFNTTSIKAIENKPAECLNRTAFDNVVNEQDFKEVFFEVMHLLKAKSTLSDYLDLNRRYIRTTDIVLFEDGVVKLDIIPKYFFNSIADELYSHAFTQSDKLYDDVDIQDIADCLVIDETTIINGVNAELDISVTTVEEARNAIERNRYRRLKHLIDVKFTDDKLQTLLQDFEDRKDTEIKSMVTENADIPTIFEYVLGIIWYKISDMQGKILDYMKLSLDADLLPKTHAAGGEADIVYEYDETEYYPRHSLLLEATLADGTNQRRMEMEPVSRHLGRHLLRTGNMNSYCVFITTYLDINVISDFRSRKNIPFYDTQDYDNYIEGMKIIPLDTELLKEFISKSVKYRTLYAIFDEAHNSASVPHHRWLDECVKQKISAL